MNLNKILAANVKHLQEVRGLNDRQLSSAAEEKGQVLGNQTISNIKSNKNDFKGATLAGFAAGLKVTAHDLVNPVGFDSDGFSRASSMAFPGDSISFAVDQVFNLADNVGITDRDWIRETIKKVALITAVEGEDAGNALVLEEALNGNIKK